ncbi:MAG: hypothetical protein EU552_02295 [Promethearchaeota archaeon]|nr:MAG: hypothetical protein EU552_02295 [Candidatus Lokiarchaeota archaeon]
MSEIETTYKYFIYTTIFVICLTMLLTLVPVWQLVIIPCIVAGFFNKQLRYAILSGLTGITISWLIYIIVAFATRNTYAILDQVGALMVGTGFGGLILLIIVVIGLLMGALGGGLGYSISILLKPYLDQKIRKIK